MATPSMSSRDRVLGALRGGPVDRPPVCAPTSVVTRALMDLVDAPFPRAHRDPDWMARLAATSYTELGFDTIMPVFSIVQESSALGCPIRWEHRDNWPAVEMRRPLWKTAEQIDIPADFLEHPDVRCVLSAMEKLKKKYGREAAVIGKAMGPWSLAYHCFGLEPFLLLSLDDPDQTRRILDRLKEVTVRFARAQMEAGADALTLPDHATGDLVSGEFYRRFLRDIHAELADRIPIPVILHICGRTLDRLDAIAETGVAAFHFDSKNDPRDVVSIARGRIALAGSINNPQTLFARGPDAVRNEVFNNLAAGVSLIGPECAIPLETPLENLKEIPKAVVTWHRGQGQGIPKP